MPDGPVDWVKWAADARPGDPIPSGYNSDVILGKLAGRLLELEARIAQLEAEKAADVGNIDVDPTVLRNA